MNPISSAALVGSIWSFIAPFAKKLAGELSKKSLEPLPEVVNRVWDLVKGKMEESFESNSLPAELIAAPDDPDIQGAFKYQLKKLLENDTAFANRLQDLVHEAEQQKAFNVARQKGNGAVAQGDGAVAVGRGGIYVGGNVSDSNIVTGNSNSIDDNEKKKR